jgi:hypothetical protein
MAPWQVITGFGFDDWIYWRLLVHLLLITFDYNSRQSMTAWDSLHSDWTTIVFSSSLSSTVLTWFRVTSQLPTDLQILSSWFFFILRALLLLVLLYSASPAALGSAFYCERCCSWFSFLLQALLLLVLLSTASAVALGSPFYCDCSGP